MRILLAEDDVALADAVCSYLRAKAYVVDVAPGLAQASAALHAAEYAAVLLDLHLSDGDGLALLPQVRALKNRPIVIVLTARDQVSDRIRGLDAGADDYLVKPFGAGELLARVRAQLRQQTLGTASADPVLRFAPGDGRPGAAGDRTPRRAGAPDADRIPAADPSGNAA